MSLNDDKAFHAALRLGATFDDFIWGRIPATHGGPRHAFITTTSTDRKSLCAKVHIMGVVLMDASDFEIEKACDICLGVVRINWVLTRACEA